MKRYKFSVWFYLFPVLLILAASERIIYSSCSLRYRIAFIGFIILNAVFIWIIKTPRIEINEEQIIFLSPFIKRWSKRINGDEILAIYTLVDDSGLVGQYVIPKIRTLNRSHDENINSIITKDISLKESKKQLMRLIRQHKIYRIPQVRHYYDLLEEICKRSSNAIIDSDTKGLVEGKGRVITMMFSKKVRAFFRRK